MVPARASFYFWDWLELLPLKADLNNCSPLNIDETCSTKASFSNCSLMPEGHCKQKYTELKA